MCAVSSEAATLPLTHRDAATPNAVTPSKARQSVFFFKNFQFFENFVPQIPKK